jgi:hypothetical protein
MTINLKDSVCSQERAMYVGFRTILSEPQNRSSKN